MVMPVTNMTPRDRLQVAAFQAFFKCELLINKQPAIIALALAIAKSSGMIFDKMLQKDSNIIEQWLASRRIIRNLNKGTNNESAKSNQEEVNEMAEVNAKEGRTLFQEQEKNRHESNEHDWTI